MVKKTVCIVGAGPGGLVSAKVLLRTGQFDVTVFEKSSRLGGIWAIDEHSTTGYLSPNTPTNLSRFQVAFSDLAWESVDLTNDKAKKSGHIPLFPQAWQVNRYLECYRQKYIPRDKLHFDTTVIAVQRAVDGIQQWTITVSDKSGKHQHRFDHLIVASGFFAKPRALQQVIPRLPADLASLPIKIKHSSEFRQLVDIMPPHSAPGNNILIIGGSNSAGEAAGVLATQLSDSQYSSNQSRQEAYQDSRIIHITPRPLYAVPPYLPADPNYCTYVPLDFNFYDLGKRLPGPIIAGAGLATNQLRDMIHDGIQTSIGGDQSDLGAVALVPLTAENEQRGTVQVALTESYAEYVRSGLIDVTRGKVSTISAEDDTVTVEVQHEGKTTKIDNIGAIIYATGYTPIPALEMLDDETKKEVHHDAQSMRLPLILQGWQSSVPEIPDLAFHGFYEGPYWGIMEMQARLTAHRWLGKEPIARRAYEAHEDLIRLRHAMKERQLNVPQYWFGDYGGYMEEMAAAMKLDRNDGSLGEREGAVVPARYLSSEDDVLESEKTMADLKKTREECKQGRYLARAAFRALQGNWQFTRHIDSRRSSYPSGTVEGTASFHPRSPPPSQQFDLEYLYIETGVFKTAAGLEMNTSRRYVYRYSEARDEVSVWFVKPENDLEVDYLFHNLTFASPSITEKEGAATATADHLCVKDMYETQYRLPMKGIILPSFTVRHRVYGPEKNYLATTMYVRGER